MTLLSRIGGFARDMVLANTFGASLYLDAFLIAFKIPNFMRRIFAEGAFSQAFVPIFSEIQKDDQTAHQFISQAAGCLIVTLMAIISYTVIFPKSVISLFAYGLVDDPATLNLTAGLLQWTMPYLGFIALVTLYGTVNNCRGQFAATAAAPILLNLAMICGAIFSHKMTPQIFGLAYAIPVAGLLQLSLVLFYFRGRIDLPRPNFKSEKIRQFLKAFSIIVGGSIVAQLNLVIDTLFASFLPTGSISWLYYADRLINMPIGIIAVSVATLLLPKLSQSISDKNTQQLEERISWALRLTYSGMLPCVLIISLLGIPMITTIYLHGSYSINDAIMTHKALLAMNFGLPAIMFNKIFMIIFFAHKKLKTPTIIALLNGAISVSLNMLLIPHYGHVALALSLSISAWCQFLLLSFWSYRNGWLHFNLKALLPWTKLTMICLFICMLLNFITPDIHWWMNVSIFTRCEMFISMATFILAIFFLFLKKLKLLEQILL